MTSFSLRIYFKPQSLLMLILGLCSGLPVYLITGTSAFWMREAGVSLSSIGIFSWVTLAYVLKVLWAPLIDRLPIPVLTRRLGRYRSWALLAQLFVVAGLTGMALTDPAQHLYRMALCAVVAAFASATQDIAVDGWRISLVEARLQGALFAVFNTGYQVARIISGAGLLALAAFFDKSEATYEQGPWMKGYLAMALFLSVCSTLALFFGARFKGQEPVLSSAGLRCGDGSQRICLSKRFVSWFSLAFVSPFMDFIGRYQWQAVLILGLISLYKISDIVLGVMAIPFYVDMGFTKLEVAAISKTYGIAMTLIGSAFAGGLMLRYGVLRVLFMGGVLAPATNILFATMSQVGHSVPYLIMVISLDNLTAGLASTAFVAYMSGLTNISFSATQYALFSSLMLLFPRFVAGFSGRLVTLYGYQNFFLFTAVIGIPVLVLIALAAKKAPAVVKMSH